MAHDDKPSPQQEQPRAIPLPWHRWSFYAGNVGWICRDCGQVATWQGGARPCQQCGARPEREFAFDLCEHCEAKYHFVCRDKHRTPQEIASIKLATAKRLIEDNQSCHPERGILEEI